MLPVPVLRQKKFLMKKKKILKKKKKTKQNQHVEPRPCCESVDDDAKPLPSPPLPPSPADAIETDAACDDGGGGSDERAQPHETDDGSDASNAAPLDQGPPRQ